MNTDSSNTPLPIAAPCRSIAWNAPLHWIRLGFADLRLAAKPSLFYGFIMLIISYAITVASWYAGRIGIYLGVMSGFVFLGPVLALRLYVISKRLQQGKQVGIASSFREAQAAFGDVMVFALALLILCLIWARVATVIHIFFPTGSAPSLSQWLSFLGIGSTFGAFFCLVMFSASAFSLPMMMDRRCDTITAVVSSINATLRNKPAMLCWITCIFACVLIGLLTAYLAFIVLLPVLGHAAWHGYKATLDTEAWPERLALDDISD